MVKARLLSWNWKGCEPDGVDDYCKCNKKLDNVRVVWLILEVRANG